MKRLLFTGLIAGLFSGSAAFAQNNGSYVDDVYYNGSQAQQDAKAEAKKQKKQQQQSSSEAAEYYNSSTGNNDGYNGDDAYVYNDSYSNGDNTYIDYDDDSYTSRIRRFQYPMYNVGYWGSVYSPFWYDPFYSNPYYGWGGWYTPGFSIGFGWGGGPYWNNCWGMNTWYGYGMFNSWYYPYGGYGGWGGYGGGYWNGYYAGLYDAGRYSTGRGAVNYGPRGSRAGLTSVGSYGRNSGFRTSSRSGNMMEPMSARRNNGTVITNGAAVNNNGRAMQVEGQRSGRVSGNGDAIRFGNNERINEVNQGARSTEIQETPVRRGGLFNRNSDRGSIRQQPVNVERSQPSRSYNMERSQPSRSFTPSSSPAPSRSYSSPSPSRSFGGGGGGGRMSGGRR